MCRERKTKIVINLKQNEARSARAESTYKGVNKRSKYVIQVQKQRPKSPTVTHLACVSKRMYLWWSLCTL